MKLRKWGAFFCVIEEDTIGIKIRILTAMRQIWFLAVAWLTKLTILTKHGLKRAAKNINRLQVLSYKVSQPVPRHREIKEYLAKHIIKMLKN